MAAVEVLGVGFHFPQEESVSTKSNFVALDSLEQFEDD
jgi:hypothetical protein